MLCFCVSKDNFKKILKKIQALRFKGIEVGKDRLFRNLGHCQRPRK